MHIVECLTFIRSVVWFMPWCIYLACVCEIKLRAVLFLCAVHIAECLFHFVVEFLLYSSYHPALVFNLNATFVAHGTKLCIE